MRLGFIGTGEIASAIVTGLSSSDIELESIRLSPRNFAIATDLSQRFRTVSIASSNREVVDDCDTVIIAVRSPVARSVLSELRFRSSHCIISVVSSLPLRTISELVSPASRITRAVPLPSTAKRIGPTAIYPPDPLVGKIFAAVGTVFEVESEDEFEAICAATATIAASYALLDVIAAWLLQNRVPEPKAREYISRMFFGLTRTAVDAPEETFQSLSKHHATVGGTNEQFLKHMVENGFLESVSRGLDAVLRRIKSASRE
jgi:pyrroline-5-carboxylate reductase